MPFTLDKKYDPLCKEGWNEAWNEAENKRKLKNALIMVNKFGISVNDVVKEFNIPKDILIKELNKSK